MVNRSCSHVTWSQPERRNPVILAGTSPRTGDGMEQHEYDARSAGPKAPEMIVRAPATGITRVVVGVDGSAGAAAAVYWAAAEACRRQVALRIVSAWDERDESGSSNPGEAVRIAAARVQKALARVLSRQLYPRRIACAAPRGYPGQALLAEAGETGLLVLGVTHVGAVLLPGRINRYCQRLGSNPLVFVPPTTRTRPLPYATRRPEPARDMFPGRQRGRRPALPQSARR
jgi:Universal stress protein family